MVAAHPDDSAYIEVGSVSKKFALRGANGAATMQALNDVSFTIGRHELVSVIGPSGCGKTTLLRIIAGLERADAGTVTIDGQQVHRPSQDRAVVFQQPALLPWANVADNVSLGLRMRGVRRIEGRRRAVPLLETLGLAGFESQLPRELSGGMQQRVALARALVVNPSVLLMDEPFAALDEITRRRLQKGLMELWEREPRAGMFVTHNVDEAILLADRVVIMSPRPGRIAEIYDVPLPRPRTVELEQSDGFVASRAHIWRRIEEWV